MSLLNEETETSEKQDIQNGIPTSTESSKSALQHNIESKGSNAYYFAHAHKANGPAWDGRPEPRLLSSSIESNSSLEEERLDSTSGSQQDQKKVGHTSSFDYTKSTISRYAFLDEGSKVRIYVELPGVGSKCQPNDARLEYTESSFSFHIQNYSTEPSFTSEMEKSDTKKKDECLSFAKLSGLIVKASYKIKPDKVVITLYKKKKSESETVETNDTQYDEWQSIGAQTNSFEDELL